MLRTALLALLSLLAVGSLHIESARAAIRGTVTVPRTGNDAAPNLNPYPGKASSMASPARLKRGAVTDAVIYLDGPVPSRATAPSSPVSIQNRLAQKGQAFVPRVMAILAGTRVEFPNEDPIYHNVFSVSPAKRFDLGKYSRGKSKSVTFEKPGRINIYCDIHSNMEAFIVVLSNRWFAQPDASGRFTLPDLPPGRYPIKAWHPDLGERSLTLEVSEGGDSTLEVAF